MAEIKEGTKTTEFKFAVIVGLILSGLVSFGKISQAEADIIKTNFAELLEVLGILVTTLAYIWSRTMVKRESEKAKAEEARKAAANINNKSLALKKEIELVKLQKTA